MDLAALAESVNQINVQWWPYFDLVHCILACTSVRDQLKSLEFSRKNPFSTYLSCMLTIFAGGLICNPLLGEPVLGALKNQQLVVMATIVWYLTFYCPFDLMVNISKVFPVKVVMSVMKEVYRTKKVAGGVALGAKVFPGNYLIMIIIGTIKGNGSAFMKIIAGLFRGTWDTKSMEVVSPSFQTKGCLIASVIFILETYTNLITVPHALVCLGVGSFFVYSKLVSLFDVHKPIIPLESNFCYLFCGGLLDSMDGVSENNQSESKKTD
ncbi:unnamed protein product [Meganyctiphanes norvegica]|uniref:Trimeric intracellular cation channel type B n=1 Tax=Meganyctiphanes norvegica TaxID=48144 RepID=A0AAV2QAG3_MEGNR